jgi:hypothetical protein
LYRTQECFWDPLLRGKSPQRINFFDESISYCIIAQPLPKKTISRKLGYTNSQKTDTSLMWSLRTPSQHRQVMVFLNESACAGVYHFGHDNSQLSKLGGKRNGWITNNLPNPSLIVG